MKNYISLEYGACAATLSKQLAAAGYKFKTQKTSKIWQKLAESLVHLHVIGAITDSEVRKVRIRFTNKISKIIVKKERCSV